MVPGTPRHVEFHRRKAVAHFIRNANSRGRCANGAEFDDFSNNDWHAFSTCGTDQSRYILPPTCTGRSRKSTAWRQSAMSTMLTLIQAGWSSIRSSVAQGRRTDALDRLARLLARPDVPAAVAADAHRLTGELLTHAERYSQARRHLRAAAALEANNARTYFLWGLAEEHDPHGNDRRAALRYLRASRLDSRNPLYRASFGRAAVRCDLVKLGVRETLAAVDAAPGEMDVLRVAIDGLLAAERPGTARRVLNRASFLCRQAAKSRELRTLLERVRFDLARRCQRGVRGTTRLGQEAGIARDGARVVLPFIRVAKELPNRVGSVRRDVVSFPRPHFPRLLSRKVDR